MIIPLLAEIVCRKRILFCFLLISIIVILLHAGPEDYRFCPCAKPPNVNSSKASKRCVAINSHMVSQFLMMINPLFKSYATNEYECTVNYTLALTERKTFWQNLVVRTFRAVLIRILFFPFLPQVPSAAIGIKDSNFRQRHFVPRKSDKPFGIDLVKHE